MHLFGKKKAAEPKPGTADAVTQMREHLGSMDKKADFLDKKINDMVTEAKRRMKSKDKKGALMCLKKKKMYEGQRTTLDNTKFAMEQQVMMLESAEMTKNTFQAQKLGLGAMKAVQKDLNVDEVDDLQEDLREQMDDMNDIQDMMGQSLGGDMMDDDELEAEFDELCEGTLDEDLADLDVLADPFGSVALPDVPIGMPAAAAAEPAAPAAAAEDDELANLEASMMM